MRSPSQLLSWQLLLATVLAPAHGTEAELLTPGSVYAGSYKCGNSAWLLMHVEEASAAGVKAIFHFMYPSSTQHGAFLLHGTVRQPGSELGTFTFLGLLLTSRVRSLVRAVG
jgi:hypothetical protein